MDSEETVTLNPSNATNLERRLAQLVLDLERDGYRIGAGQSGNYWIQFPETPAGTRHCARARFNLALEESPELEAAVWPFLQRCRPASMWGSANG